MYWKIGDFVVNNKECFCHFISLTQADITLVSHPVPVIISDVRPFFFSTLCNSERLCLWGWSGWVAVSACHTKSAFLSVLRIRYGYQHVSMSGMFTGETPSSITYSSQWWRWTETATLTSAHRRQSQRQVTLHARVLSSRWFKEWSRIRVWRRLPRANSFAPLPVSACARQHTFILQMFLCKLFWTTAINWNQII